VEKLAAFSQNAAQVAEPAFRERWMDLLPRKGKVGGAYCMPRGGGKSLILANYEESFESVSTLAHELGTPTTTSPWPGSPPPCGRCP
jgi:oligoendopeptidase F